MSKSCHVCGMFLDDNATFCTNCGSQMDAPAKSKGKPLAVLIAVLVVALVGILGFTIVFAIMGGNYVTAVNEANKLLAGDTKLLEDMVPEKAWATYEDEELYNLEEMLDEADGLYDDFVEDMEKTYGNDLTMKLVVSEVKKTSASKLKSMSSLLNEYCGISKDSVKESRTLTAHLSMSGDEDYGTEDLENLYAVKINNKWYLLFYQADEEPIFFATWLYEEL